MHDLALDEIREQKSLFGVNTEMDGDKVRLDDVREPASLFDPQPINGDEEGGTDMQTLGLCDDTKPKEETGFWRRQFQQESTRRQRQYDWAFGVIMPLICFFFDPFIFRSWDQSGGMLSTYKPFAYSGSAIAIAMMVTWLLFRDRLGWFNALFAGVFFAASIPALAVGVALIPMSLLGLVLLIGVLGFTPLFTGVIFLRNGVRALRMAKSDIPRTKLAYASILGTIWALVIPFTLQTEIDRSVQLIANGTPETIRVQGLKLRLLSPMVDASQIRRIDWDVPKGSEERQEIELLYRQLTGKNVNDYDVWD